MEYNICGKSITFPVEVENERYIRCSLGPLVIQAGVIFDKWYAAQHSCQDIINHCGDVMYSEIITPIISKGVEILNAQGVYTINEDVLLEKYLDPTNFDDEFIDIIAKVKSSVREVEEEQQEERYYRQMRKADRGKVRAVGFGLGNYIGASIQAGMVNAATGAAHSVANAIGNAGSSVSASASKSSIFKEVRQPLRNALVNAANLAMGGIRTALAKEAGIKCKPVTQSEADKAKAILDNYQQGRIPKKLQKEQLVEALRLNPYYFDLYLSLWTEYGDENGELRKMAEYFGIGLVEHIKKLAVEHGDELYAKVGIPYEKVWNKKEEGLAMEKGIRQALNDILKYAAKCDVKEEEVPVVEKCRNILEEIDVDARTFRGVTYDTRKHAKNIEQDYEKFYSTVKEMPVLDEKAYETLSSQTYLTEEFKNSLKSLFDRECRFRMPEKIYENLFNTLTETLENTQYETWVSIPGHIGTLRENEDLIRSTTQMPEEEVPLALFSTSSGKTGKNGVLITNCNFRIFAKGLLPALNKSQAYSLEQISNIKCRAKDEYVLEFKEQESKKFHLGQGGLAAQEQIAIGEMLSEMVRIVRSLSEEGDGLRRILYGTVRCVCGTNLLQGEKLCPSCKRMLTLEGEFVETKICPGCNNYVPVGKKFCYLCGYNLMESQPNLEQEKEQTMREKVFCPSCGKQLSSSSKFCSQCGTKLQ